MRLSLLAVLLLLAACATRAPEDKLSLAPVDVASLPGWAQDDHASALATFLQSCDAFDKASPERVHGKGDLAGPSWVWKKACEKARSTRPEQARLFFENEFVAYKASNKGKEEGLFTGYYEPVLSASLKPTPTHRFPIYGLPKDLTKEPYYTRAQIDAGALKNKKLEIAWTDDKIGLFFAEIQGSARLRLPDGSEQRIGFAGKNNRDYVAIGKVLIDSGELTKENVNLFTIRDWLIRHPGKAQGLMQQNPSFVFFRFVESINAIGAQGVPLTPHRSLAVDWRFIPYGTPVYLQTTLPATAYNPLQPLNRLMVAQDTGGAIRGPVRGDVFYGPGVEAEALAGVMKQQGTYALLLPSGLADSIR